MRSFVIIATKGRAKESQRLLDDLQQQTMQPTFTFIVGTEEGDLDGIREHPWIKAGRGEALISPKKGLAAQRNFGLRILEQRDYTAQNAGHFFCAFFDDDYRLSCDWLQRAQERFAKGGVVGLTGRVLADGIKTGGLSEEQASKFLKGGMPIGSPPPRMAIERDAESAYGCNMAFIDLVVREVRFDENLPLYGWLEDLDYSAMARRLGRVIYYPNCQGVHLGVKADRVNGTKFGYSQIANPFYLAKKGTIERRRCLRLIVQALAANMIRGLITGSHPGVDYRGRLQGNIRAIVDIILLRSHPLNIARDNAYRAD